MKASVPDKLETTRIFQRVFDIIRKDNHSEEDLPKDRSTMETFLHLLETEVFQLTLDKIFEVRPALLNVQKEGGALKQNLWIREKAMWIKEENPTSKALSNIKNEGSKMKKGFLESLKTLQALIPELPKWVDGDVE